MDMTIPAAPTASTDSAASPVTTPSTPAQSTPQADKPAGTPQATEPAGQSTADDTASSESPSQEEQSKTWKEKRQERNRQRWQEYKATHGRLARLETEVRQLRGTPEPDYSKITDPTEELAERTAWKVEQRRAQDLERQVDAERVEAAAKLKGAWEEVKQEARQRIPDFDAVVNNDTPIHARAGTFIVESDLGADIAYHLGKPENRDYALSLYDKFETNPAQAFVELGRLETRLSVPKAKTVSTAPKPPNILAGGSNPLGFDPQKSGVSDMQAHLKKSGILR